MTFRIGSATSRNYSHAYWFNDDPKTPYELLTNTYKGVLNFHIEFTDKTIWVKKGNKSYKQITLEELKQYIKEEIN